MTLCTKSSSEVAVVPLNYNSLRQFRNHRAQEQIFYTILHIAVFLDSLPKTSLNAVLNGSKYIGASQWRSGNSVADNERIGMEGGTEHLIRL